MTVTRLTVPDPRFQTQAAGLLLAIAAGLALLLVWAPGTEDVQAFLKWASLGQQYGLIDGYREMVDRWPETQLPGHYDAGGGWYPPLGFAWLYGTAALADLIGMSHFAIFKVGILVFSFLSTLTIWFCCRSLPLAAAFQGATILSATGLGYMDVVAAPFLIGALWAVRDERPILAAALFLVSAFIKWQALLITPFLLVHVLNISDWRSIGQAFRRPLLWKLAAVTVIAVLAVGIPFGDRPLRAFRYALQHTFLSGNALNVPWIAGVLAHALRSPGSLPFLSDTALRLQFRLVFCALFVWILLRYLRTERSYANCLLFSILGVITYGVWNSAVHENHWFVALIPAFLLAAVSQNRSAQWICLLVAVMLNVNLFVFYGITGQKLAGLNDTGIDVSVVLALLYAAIWLALMLHAWAIKPVGSSSGGRGILVEPSSAAQGFAGGDAQHRSTMT
jgi:hypothetical protein